MSIDAADRRPAPGRTRRPIMVLLAVFVALSAIGGIAGVALGSTAAASSGEHLVHLDAGHRPGPGPGPRTDR